MKAPIINCSTESDAHRRRVEEWGDKMLRFMNFTAGIFLVLLQPHRVLAERGRKIPSTMGLELETAGINSQRTNHFGRKKDGRAQCIGTITQASFTS